ncbi:MAG: DUF4129 domain-containing protein [Euryarchaeota archaeon]|nr:DUF4129 domain-containing protein [Euryarchaeota archaeon]
MGKGITRETRRPRMATAGDLFAFLRARRRRLAAAGLLLVSGLVIVAAVGSTYFGRFSESRQLGLENVTEDSSLAIADSDSDGVSDLDELFRYGSDPFKADTDGDGAPDKWEADNRRLDAVSGVYRPDASVFDSGDDADRDGLDNVGEFVAGTDPWAPDSDADGMPDGYEIRSGLDPSRNDAAADNDGDGLVNIDEFRRGTNASKRDSDDDGLEDPQEIDNYKTDPVRFSTSGAGIADGWLVFYKLDALDVGVAFLDPDGDGLTTQDEFLFSARVLGVLAENVTNRAFLFSIGLDPGNNDTDADGMGDGWEVKYFLDPLSPGDASADLDSDGLTNLQEFLAFSDPRSKDTDGDGLSDLQEVGGWEITVEERTFRTTSSPSLADTDGDGLTDLEEFDGYALRGTRNLTFARTDPRRPDTDLDGLDDAFEVSFESTPRLSPVAGDSDGDGLLDGDEHAYWTLRSLTVSDEAIAAIKAERGRRNVSGVETGEDIKRALQPGGDIDIDGIPNVVDPDSDADTILDGDELVPPRRKASLGREDLRTLPVTDPGTRDSDQDQLPDDWENRFASFNDTLLDWNLNASARDSLRLSDGKSDADRDLDGDGARFYTGGSVLRLVYTNIEEFARGTNPNLGDSDADNITDGWEVYFKRNPLNSSDARQTLSKLEYVRFAGRDGSPTAGELTSSVPLDAKNKESFVPTEASSSGTGGDVFYNIPKSGGGSRTVVRVHGTFELTYEAAYNFFLNPDKTDTDDDSLPDAWELYYSGVNPAIAIELSPINGEGATSDFDADGLTNLEEFERGTSPVPTDKTSDGSDVGDTDLGGETDGNEVDRSLDALMPFDDDPNGDLDCDGITNIQERRTLVADFDSDRDSLLDGPSISTSNPPPPRCTIAEMSARFRARGIVERAGTFLGEDEFGTDPAAFDSEDGGGDGMPDGWEVYYGLNPTLNVGAVNSDTVEADGGDGLDDLTEYRLGLPRDWDPATDGVWWFGSSPRSVPGGPPGSDTDGDSSKDGYVDDADQQVGSDLDYDNDGLDDFNGEDAQPFFDHNNSGSLDPKDPVAARNWVTSQRTATRDIDRDGDGVPDARDMARTKLTIDSVSANSLFKGDSVTVTGTLMVDEDTADKGKPVGGAMVLANFVRKSSNESRVAGAAQTMPDGTFTMVLSLASDHSLLLRAPAILFGTNHSAGETVTWALDTGTVPLGLDDRLFVWAYAVSAIDGPYAFAAKNRDVTGSIVTRNAEGTYKPDVVAYAQPFTVRSETRIRLPTDLKAENGGILNGSGTLLDRVGLPISGKDVTIRFNNGTQSTVTTDASGSFQFTIPVGTLPQRGRYPLNASFAGDADRLTLPSTSEAGVDILFGTSMTAVVENERRSVRAGESLVITGKVVDVDDHPAIGNVTMASYGAAVETTLDAAGRYRLEAPIPRDATPEARTFVVQFPQANSFSAASAVVESVIITQSTRVVLDPQYFRPLVSEDVVVAGQLVDQAGRPVRDFSVKERLTVRVALGASNVEVPVDNATSTFKTTISRFSTPGVGETSVVVSFTGTNLYAQSSTVAVYSVVTTTSLEFPPKRLERGNVVVLGGRLLDALGRPIASQTVNVSFEGEALEPATTDANGRFERGVALPANKTLGLVEARARYPGSVDGLKKASPEVVTYFNVVTRVTITLPDKVLPFGRLNITGRLTNDEGNVVPSARVNVKVNGASIGNVVTDFGGDFEAEYLPQTTDVVDFVIEAKYVGEGIYGDATGSAKYITIARTTVKLDSVTGFVRGGQVALTARLIDEFGRPIRGAEVEALLGDAKLAVLNTASGGAMNASLRLPIDMERGKYPFVLRYRGDKNHFGTDFVEEVSVVGETDLRLYTPNRLTVGQSFVGRIQLLDDEGGPIKDAVLQLRVSGYIYPFLLRTNDTGEATFPAKVLSEGKTQVDVRYQGSDILLPATRTFSINSLAAFGPVSREEALVLAAAAFALLAVGLAAAYVYWSRSAATEAAAILKRAEGQLVAGSEYVATILAAYRALVEYLRKYGYAVTPDLTAQEFSVAVKAAFPVDETRLDEFIGLFEEARYSAHEIGPAERQRAISAFRAVQRGLSVNKGTRPGPPTAGAGDVR